MLNLKKINIRRFYRIIEIGTASTFCLLIYGGDNFAFFVGFIIIFSIGRSIHLWLNGQESVAEFGLLDWGAVPFVCLTIIILLLFRPPKKQLDYMAVIAIFLCYIPAYTSFRMIINHSHHDIIPTVILSLFLISSIVALAGLFQKIRKY